MTEAKLDGGWSNFPTQGWTCPECGFDFDTTEPGKAPEYFAKVGKRLRAPLTRGLPNEDLDATLRTRPGEQWSALEYACHIRDAMQLNVERFAEIRAATEPPEFVALGRDEKAIEWDYNGQDPAVVADEIDAVAAALAEAIAAVGDDEWQKYGQRGDLVFTLDWMARNVQHEVDHHMLDIGRTLRTVRGR
jgi:hypothetical protein